MKYTVFFYLLFFLNLSKANILCKNLFVQEQNKLEFVQVEQSSIGQKLLNVMPNINPKLWRRYWNTKETNLISSELQANTVGKTNIIRVENYGTIYFTGINLKNPMLIEILRENNFVLERRHNQINFIKKIELD